MENLTVNGTEYEIKKLLGKAKGGYSYLAEKDGKEYVVKELSVGSEIKANTYYEKNITTKFNFKINTSFAFCKNKLSQLLFVKGMTIASQLNSDNYHSHVDLQVDKFGINSG